MSPYKSDAKRKARFGAGSSLTASFSLLSIYLHPAMRSQRGGVDLVSILLQSTDNRSFLVLCVTTEDHREQCVPGQLLLSRNTHHQHIHS